MTSSIEGLAEQAIAITRPDGGVSVMYFTTSAPVRCFAPGEAASAGYSLSNDGASWLCEATDERINQEIARSGIAAVSWSRIEKDAVPQDRTFRDAWRHGKKGFGVDMPQARSIQRQRLREMRAPLLNALDVEALRAVESGTSIEAVSARKQALRDITKHPAIDAAKTPDELKLAGLDVLGA